MKKNPVYIACLLALSFQSLIADAQSVEIGKIQVDGYQGVHEMIDPITDELKGYYTFYWEKNGSSQNLEVILFDNDLIQTNKVMVSGIKNKIIEAPIFNGSHITIYSTNQYTPPESTGSLQTNDGIMDIVSISLQGEVVGRKSLKYFRDTWYSVTEPIVKATEDGNGIYISRPWIDYSLKSYTGQYVTYLGKYNNDLSVEWEKTFAPPKKIRGFLSNNMFSGLDRVYLVQSTLTSMSGDIVTIKYPELLCFDANNGDLLFRQNLYVDKVAGLPTVLETNDKGEIFIAGELYLSGKLKFSNSDGVYVKKLSESGGEILVNYYSWKDAIKKQLKKTELKVTGTNKFILHDVLMSEDGGFQLIGESFSRRQLSGNQQEKKNLSMIKAVKEGRYFGDVGNTNGSSVMMTQDLISFDFSEGIELTNVNKIEKDYTKYYAMDPFSDDPGLKLGKKANSFGMMDFRFTQYDSESGSTQLIYNSLRAKQRHIGIVDIEKGSSNTTKRLLFDDIAVNEEVSHIGVSKANDGRVLIHYLKNDRIGMDKVLVMSFQLFGEGTYLDAYKVQELDIDDD